MYLAGKKIRYNSTQDQREWKRNLMLIESSEDQRYCDLKQVGALLVHQSKNSNAKHYCARDVLDCFLREDLTENHKKYCNGVNGRSTRTGMPEEGFISQITIRNIR